VVKMLNGALYVLACGGLKGGYDDVTLETLALVAKEHKVNHVLVESNFGDGMFTKLLTPWLVKHHPVTTEEIHHTGQKEKRIIDVLEPALNQHRVVVDEKVILEDLKTDDVAYSLLHQLTRITRDKGALGHDDRVEALAMAVGYWTEQMDRDAKAAEEDHRQQKLDEELERFMERALGHRKSQSWSGLDRVAGFEPTPSADGNSRRR
jgi:molybdopterin-biosynthesis enzyme MoeA-like protein